MHLTYRDSAYKRRLAASAGEAGAPEIEIEITPEMTEAGAEVMWRALDGFSPYGSDVGRHWAAEVFAATAKTSACSSKPLPHISQDNGIGV